MPSGAQAIFVASNGPYDFLGTKYFRASEGNRFDRLRVVQDGQSFSFVQGDYLVYRRRHPRAAESPALFALPANSGFDPLKPWRLELLVNGAGAAPVTVAFGLDYKIPDVLVLMPPPPEPPAVPAWVEAWHDGRVNVAILAVLLSVLTLIFVFQAPLARSRLAHRLVRNGFLLVVLVWLGWTAGVQLSIVNVINYLKAPFNHFDIGFYLAEPLMVIIAAYTLISVVLIGRGVFCGWLCPFGALQELLGQVSRALGVPQWNPSAALEKRLWMGKYIAAAVVLVLVMTAIDPSGGHDRDRAVQDRDHLEIHPRLALCALRRRAAGHRAVLGARLLPLPVPARRRARRRSIGCTSSICSSAVPNAAVPAICASAPARCGRSRRPARSSPRNASSASTARSNIMTTSAVRRWCRPPSSVTRRCRLPPW